MAEAYMASTPVAAAPATKRSTGRRWATTSCVVLAVAMLLTACGDGGSGGGEQGSGPPLPRRGDPAYGALGQLLVSDRGIGADGVLDEMWVGFDDETRWATVVSLVENGATPSLDAGGTLVIDARQPLGFYLDPATTLVTQVTVMATSLDGLKHLLAVDPDSIEGRSVRISVRLERIVAAER